MYFTNAFLISLKQVLLFKNYSRNEAFLGHQNGFFYNENMFIKGAKSVSQMRCFLFQQRVLFSSFFFIEQLWVRKKDDIYDKITSVIAYKHIKKKNNFNINFIFQTNCLFEK